MSKKYSLLVSIVLLLTLTAISSAVTRNWDNEAADGNWTVALNWSGDTVPTATDDANIPIASGPVFSAGRSATINRVFLRGANGSLTMSGGSLTANNYFDMAYTSTESATLTVSSGTITITGASGHLYCGRSGAATLNMSGGTIDVAATFYVARDLGSTGTVNLSGGTIDCNVLSMRSNNTAANGTINITSTGTLVIDGNVTVYVTTCVNNGWIKAYSGAGTVVLDYNSTNPGKTTVTASAPTKAGAPSPANNATNVSILADLSWVGMPEANSHDVYFGTDSTPDETEFQGNQTETTFDPCQLALDTTYYWRIDEVNGPNIVTGDVWNFTTVSGLAHDPNPANGAINVLVNTSVSWTTGGGAASHDVYFGTNPTPGPNEFKVNQPTTTYTPVSNLAANTTYYWRIDEVQADANYVYTGTLWSFTTQVALKKGPYLIYDGNNPQMLVLWQLTVTQGCTLAWGLDPNCTGGSTATTEYGADHQHKYTITGLAPGAKYYYKVTTEGSVISTSSFRAAPAADATSVKFLAYGDTRTYPADHSAVCAGMNSVIAGDPDFQTVLLHTGDWVEADTETNWANEFFNRSYPSQLQLEASLPIQGCWGNHEGASTYYTKYWPYPYVAARYWSFDYGPAHIAIVDQYTDYSPGSAQLTWLTNDLSASTKKWKFIVLHQPGWTAAGSHLNDPDVQARIQPLCEQYGVQIVFGGHDHYYARAVVNGVHHITAGGGGAPLYTPVAGQPNIVIYNKTLHYCKITIDGNSMSVETVKPDGTVVDEFYVDQEEPDFTFVQATDPQIGWTQCGNMDFMWGVAVTKVNIIEPNFLVVTGDLVDNRGNESQVDLYKSYAAGLSPSIPLYNLPGNHDIGDTPDPTSYALWKTRFGYPADNDNPWYAFSYGNNLFIVLDSMVLKSPTGFTDPNKATEEMTWLTATLAGASGYNNIMVFMHISLCLTSTNETDGTFNMPLGDGTGIRKQLLDLFHLYGVNAVFSGHAHYNSYVRDGDLEIVTTSSCNCSLGSPATPQGFRIVEVYPDHITHRYVPFPDIVSLLCDFNGDKTCDWKDVAIFMEHWLESGIWP